MRTCMFGRGAVFACREQCLEQRSLWYADVVLQCGACADACAGAGRGTLEELISSLSEEEREIVACVLGKLDKERGQRERVVLAALCELAGDGRKRRRWAEEETQCESTCGKNDLHRSRHRGLVGGGVSGVRDGEAE